MREPDDKETTPPLRKEGFLKEICENTGDVMLKDFEGTAYRCTNDHSLSSDLQHFDMPLNEVSVEFTSIETKPCPIAIDIHLFPNGDPPADAWSKYSEGRLKFLKKRCKRVQELTDLEDEPLPECVDVASVPDPPANNLQLQATNTDSTISPNITPPEEEKPTTPPVENEEEPPVGEEEPPVEEKESPLEEGEPPVEEEGASFVVQTAQGEFYKGEEHQGCVYFSRASPVKIEIGEDWERTEPDAEEKEIVKTEEKKKVLKSILKPPKEKWPGAHYLGWPRERFVVEPGWWLQPALILKICGQGDPHSISKMHRLLNKWWYIPNMRYKMDYPFTCDGFVVPIGGGKIHIYTIRLGRIEINERANRRDRPYAYFLVIAEDVYGAFEFDDLPASLEGVTPVNDTAECRGYALMSPGSPAENTWFVWNDQVGLMTCAEGCADGVKEKDPGWMPGCQLLKFDAIFVKGTWVITKIALPKLTCNEQLPFYPLDLYYIDDIQTIVKNEENNISLYSRKLGQKPGGEQIAYNYEQVYAPFPDPESKSYGGLVCVTWEAKGRQRVVRALAVAPFHVWKSFYSTPFTEAARLLFLVAWGIKRKRKTPTVAVSNPWQEDE